MAKRTKFQKRLQSFIKGFFPKSRIGRMERLRLHTLSGKNVYVEDTSYVYMYVPPNDWPELKEKEDKYRAPTIGNMVAIYPTERIVIELASAIICFVLVCIFLFLNYLY